MMKLILTSVLVFSALTLLCSAEPDGSCPEVDPIDSTVYLNDLDDCGAYYACSGGYAFQLHCAQTTYWNPELEYCVTGATAANCGSRPTTANPMI